MSEHVLENEAVTEAGHQGGSHVHIVPVRLFLLVWAALVCLTVLTVAVTYVDLGKYALWVAMGIATAKGLLVTLYFMHLRWDRLFHGFVFMAALVFVTLFIGIALMDSEHYRPDTIPGYAPAMQQTQQTQQTQQPTAGEAAPK